MRTRASTAKRRAPRVRRARKPVTTRRNVDVEPEEEPDGAMLAFGGDKASS